MSKRAWQGTSNVTLQGEGFWVWGSSWDLETHRSAHRKGHGKPVLYKYTQQLCQHWQSQNQALLLISTRILYFGLGEGLGFMLCSPWGSAKSKVIWLDVSEKVRSNRDSLRVPRVNTPEHFSSCCRVEI